MTEAYKKVVSMGEGYLIILDSLIHQAKELVEISREMETYLDSHEFITTEQPYEELQAQIELGRLMATQFCKLYDTLELLK